MLVCTDAWRLLLYFVDDLVAVGRGEAIDTMAYSADNGCRAVTAFPFQYTNAWLSFYMYISFFIPFELLYCLYYCLYLSEVTNKVVQSIKSIIYIYIYILLFSVDQLHLYEMIAFYIVGVDIFSNKII